jgi:histone H1/5
LCVYFSSILPSRSFESFSTSPEYIRSTMVVSTSGLPSGATLATAKKVAAAKAAAAKKPRVKSNHPSTADMVNAAIRSLKERGGSSFQAIKKYIAATYVIDAEKLSPFIKKYLKSAVASKELVQVKGKGASGSFKLSAAKVEGKSGPKVKRPTAVKKVAAKKTVAPKPKKAVVKKTLKKPAGPKKALKTIAAKSPKPKVRKAPKLVKKPSKPAAKKTVSKVKKSPVKKSAVKK